ncbi:MAG TPA: aminoglycoside phosphotransferase family protein [Verrucomicrobiales bacterium]|nr:aminoglycoside phosphotransferase family protein [Verrucomicrobiales bacterium]
MMRPERELAEVGAHFQIHGRFLRGFSIGTGHINDTYAADYDYGGQTVRFVHQTINHRVFPEPLRLMENVTRVTGHMASKLAEADDPDARRKALTVVPARDGNGCWKNGDGVYWRTYVYIHRATTFETLDSEERARAVARAFGRFQRMLTDIPGGRLHETIPDFHDAGKRCDALEAAVAASKNGRVSEAKDAIDFVRKRRDVAGVIRKLLDSGGIPERVTHNDTKLNNVLIDDATEEGICVIDLDTVMPGSVLYDFGDMIRTVTNPALEDERDLSKVCMRMNMFRALLEGYWSTAGGFLNETEREHLAFSGKLLALIIGARFLTDYLQGDTYFKVHRRGQNLDRARSQFRLVKSIEEQEEEMRGVVDDVVRSCEPLC